MVFSLPFFLFLVQLSSFFNMLVQMCATFTYQSIEPQLLLLYSLILASFERFLRILLRAKICQNLDLGAKNEKTKGGRKRIGYLILWYLKLAHICTNKLKDELNRTNNTEIGA